MDKENKGMISYPWRFVEEEGCYLLSVQLSREGGFKEGDPRYKNLDVVLLSPNSRVEPLRTRFVLEGDRCKTEQDFKIYPRNKENTPTGEVLLLVANQAIHCYNLEFKILNNKG